MSQGSSKLGLINWNDLHARDERIPSCAGPVTWDGTKLRGYSRVIWIPSGLGRGHHINLDPAAGSAFWEFNLLPWQIAYLDLNEADIKSPGTRVGVVTSDPRFKIADYGSYTPEENHFEVAMLNWDNMNVAGGSGQGRVFTAWGVNYDKPRAPVFENGWVNFDAAGCFYTKLHDETVKFSGAVASGAANPSAMMTLPPGFRPAREERFPVLSGGNALGWVSVLPDGRLLHVGGSNAWVDLSPIRFRAEQ